MYYVVGSPGGGKSHLAAAIGLALVENGWRVLFMRTSDLVQRLQIARRELALESALAKLDKYHLLILDDIVYVSKDQADQFANYAEYRDVDENIGLVMSGINPGTKKYVGLDAVIKKDIALIDSENLAASDKKRQLDEEQSKLKSLPEPVKFPANIDLVVKSYDKINAAMPPAQ